LVSTFLPLLCGGLFFVLDKGKNRLAKWGNFLLILFTLLSLFENLRLFKPRYYWETPYVSESTTWNDEYLPKWVKIKPLGYASQKIRIIEGKGVVKNVNWGYLKKDFVFESEKNSQIEIAHIYYPGWQARVNNQKTKIDYNNENGLMRVAVPLGVNVVTFEFQRTSWRSFSEILSLLALLVFVGLFIKFLVQKNSFTKKNFSFEELNKIWAKVPVDYYEKGTKNNWGQRIWHNQKLRVVKKLVENTSPKWVLDIGSNGGDLTAKIKTIFPKARMIGVDVYKEAIDYAKKRYPEVEFRVGDAQKLPFEKGKFDIILCLETLEHLACPQKALTEIKRCLKPNGLAVVSMDSGSLLFNIIWFFWTKFGRGKVWTGSHLTKFNKTSLGKMILDQGFLIDKEIVSHLGMAVTFRIKTS